jgi:uncharacterized protein (TIGR03067 family)
MNLTGKWKIITAELGGKQLPAKSFAKMVLELDQTSYQLIEGKVIDSGLVEVDEKTTPKSIRITGVFGPNKGKVYQCIFRFEREDLIMCYNLGGDGPPKEFTTTDHPLFYLVRYQKIS